MHRDMQSRNIMVKGDRFYFIDFQGGRLGPVQYDLASLLIDPYVDLPREIQTPLIDVCMDKLASVRNLDRHGFLEGFRYCTIARNLQILGAFGFLSREKGKTSFKKYILPAVKGLKHHLSFFPPKHFPHLSSLVKKAHATLINQKKRYGGNL